VKWVYGSTDLGMVVLCLSGLRRGLEGLKRGFGEGATREGLNGLEMGCSALFVLLFFIDKSLFFSFLLLSSLLFLSDVGHFVCCRKAALPLAIGEREETDML